MSAWVPFDVLDCDANPFVQFRRWFDEARHEMPEREAVALATSTPDGRRRLALLAAEVRRIFAPAAAAARDMISAELGWDAGGGGGHGNGPAGFVDDEELQALFPVQGSHSPPHIRPCAAEPAAAPGLLSGDQWGHGSAGAPGAGGAAGAGPFGYCAPGYAGAGGALFAGECRQREGGIPRTPGTLYAGGGLAPHCAARAAGAAGAFGDQRGLASVIAGGLGEYRAAEAAVFSGAGPCLHHAAGVPRPELSGHSSAGGLCSHYPPTESCWNSKQAQNINHHLEPSPWFYGGLAAAGDCFSGAFLSSGPCSASSSADHSAWIGYAAESQTEQHCMEAERQEDVPAGGKEAAQLEQWEQQGVFLGGPTGSDAAWAPGQFRSTDQCYQLVQQNDRAQSADFENLAAAQRDLPNKNTSAYS